MADKRGTVWTPWNLGWALTKYAHAFSPNGKQRITDWHTKGAKASPTPMKELVDTLYINVHISKKVTQRSDIPYHLFPTLPPSPNLNLTKQNCSDRGRSPGEDWPTDYTVMPTENVKYLLTFIVTFTKWYKPSPAKLTRLRKSLKAC